MTKEQAKELLPIFQAFANGKQIQFLESNGSWRDCPNPGWSPELYKYRIKPESKLVPFTFEDKELLKGRFIMTKDDPSCIYQITGIAKNTVRVPETGFYTYKVLLNKFLFDDGSPCGKYVEE